MHLLHSVALFWPVDACFERRAVMCSAEDWGVLVVLDGESVEDEQACGLMPKWASWFTFVVYIVYKFIFISRLFS